MPKKPDYLIDNQKLWDDRVSVHAQSDFYDLTSFLRGRNSLTTIELSELGDVKGKSILHLQCHFGQDSLSLARMGARVTGIDFSEEGIKTARELNGKMKLDATFIQSDVYTLPQKLNKTFDIVYTSFGVIGWLPDLNRWAEVIDAFLKPGGIFYMAEFHPFIWLLDDAKNYDWHYPYFNIKPIKEEIKGTYADEKAALTHTHHSWNHPITDVLSPLLNLGLQLDFFHEFDYSPFKIFNDMHESDSKTYHIPRFGNAFPYVYSILLKKPLKGTL